MKSLIVSMLFLSSSQAMADEVSLTLASFKDNTHLFYHDLVKSSLEKQGHTVKITSASDIPQPRILSALDGDSSDISMHWFVQASDKDTKYVPIEVGLTNNLVGHRVLFIPKGKSGTYEKVKTLDDFRKLDKIGGFGKNWFDVKVWQANGLKYLEEDGEWKKKIYPKLAQGDRGIDYFSRGVIEILPELKEHPELEIEPRLMLIYERDFRFYMTKTAGGKFKKVIEDSLKKAKETGLLDSLIRKYWKEDFEKLNFDKRVKITLASAP